MYPHPESGNRHVVYECAFDTREIGCGKRLCYLIDKEKKQSNGAETILLV